ncbi:hypothetical protein PoB_006181100 [Plakobranchus ocellatus]|uniref:Uncharacterized protein n=1 Tax=Plakobranchus ocellatus TaxID=259542 RepID=A0AAV4CTR3_9GAST|nr:hypothetical protein PoB_006181100 [Plakobranchus ocellatus]
MDKPTLMVLCYQNKRRNWVHGIYQRRVYFGFCVWPVRNKVISSFQARAVLAGRKPATEMSGRSHDGFAIHCATKVPSKKQYWQKQQQQQQQPKK